MRIIEIFGQTTETEQFDPAIFVVADSIDGPRIYCENASMGWMDRNSDPDSGGMSINQLKRHIHKMKEQGFTITDRIIGQYAERIQ